MKKLLILLFVFLFYFSLSNYSQSSEPFSNDYPYQSSTLSNVNNHKDNGNNNGDNTDGGILDNRSDHGNGHGYGWGTDGNEGHGNGNGHHNPPSLPISNGNYILIGLVLIYTIKVKYQS